MEFTFETEYNQKTLSVMAEVLRKTIRRKRNQRSHIFGWIIVVIAILFTLPVLTGKADIKINTIVTWAAAIVMVVTLLFEDIINGYVAKKRMLTGMNRATTVFDEQKYIIITEVGKSEFWYENINVLAETEEYFVFVFDKSHAQIHDKNSLSSGTLEEFRKFIMDKTEKEIFDC